MKSDFLPFTCYTAGVSGSDDVYVTKSHVHGFKHGCRPGVNDRG